MARRRFAPRGCTLNRLTAPFVVGVVTAALAVVAAPARASSIVPLAEGSAAGAIGFESIGPPSFTLDLALDAPSFVPIVTGSLDTHARTVGIVVGAAFEQRLAPGVFLREVVQMGPSLTGLDGVAPGVRSVASLAAGFDIGDDVVVTVGPEIVPVLVVDRVVDGRVGLSLVGGARWFVFPRLGFLATLAGGYDVGGAGAGAVHGACFVGVIVDAS